MIDWKNIHAFNPFLYQPIEPSAVNALDKKRTVDVFQLRAISSERIEKGIDGAHYKRGELTEKEMAFVADAIYFVVGGYKGA